MTGKYRQSELKPLTAAEDAGAQNVANSLQGGNWLTLSILMIESFALIKTGMSGVPVAVRDRLRGDATRCGAGLM